MGRNATSKIGVNAVTGRGYNPSVAPKARQLPLHSWLSSAAGGGYSEKGKPLPSASARANSRSTSGERRGSRESFCKHSVQTLHGGAEKRSANTRCKPCMGEPRTRSVTAVLAAVITPAFGGRTSSVTVQRQGAAPRHLPQGGRLITPSPLCRPAIKMCRDPRHTLTFAPKGQIFHTRGARISPPRSGDFTRRLAAVFHCGAAARRTPLNYSLFTVTYSLNSLP